MTSPLKISASVVIDATQAKTGAKEASSAIIGIGTSADDASKSIQMLIERSAGIGGSAANNNIREWSGALAMAGRSADELRAKYNPLFATISQYKQNLVEIRTLTAQGVLTTDEMTAAIQRQRQATLASIDAIKGRNTAMKASGPAAPNFAATNVMYQAQDIVMSSAMGMSPVMVGLQQGSQLAGGFAGMSIKEAGAAVAGGISGMLNPLSLVTIGLTAAASAAIGYFSRIDMGSKDSAEALKKHREDIIESAKAWTSALPELKKYTDELERKNTLEEQKGLAANIRQDIYSNVKGLSQAASVDSANVLSQLQGAGAEPSEILKLQQAIRQLNTDIAANKATSEESKSVQQQLAALYEQTHIPAVLDLAKAYETLGQQIASASAKARQIDAELTPDRTPNGLLRGVGRSSEGIGLTKSIAETRDQIRQAQGEYDQWLLSLNAKSPAEKAAAARAAEQLKPIPANEIGKPELTQQRIDLAGIKAQAEAEKQLSDAKRERLRSIDETLSSSRLELTLIGQTTSSIEAQRMELRLLTDAKNAAEKAGSVVSDKEQQRIKQAAEEYGRLAEAIKATNVLRGQNDKLDQLKLETSLVGKSEAERQKALALAEAEKTIRDQGITANSQEAQQIRAKAAAAAELGLRLNKLQDAWNNVKSAGENAIDSIGEALQTGDWSKALDTVLGDIKKSFIELGVTNPLKNALLGTNYGTLSEAGGLLGKMFGGDTASPIGASSIGAMNVSATSVIVNGSVSGSGLLGGPGTASNDNMGFLGSGAALTSKGGVEGQIWNFFAGKGLKDHQIAGILGNVARESSFNPTAVGDNGNALGLFQWNDRAPSMLNAIGGRGNLGNVQAQLEYAWKELQTSESGVLSRLLNSTNVKDATAAFAGFERPRGWSLLNPQGADGWSTRLNSATEALTKFGSNTSNMSGVVGSATQNLSGFSSGLGSLGSSLQSAANGLSSGGSGGGIGGLFSKLFGLGSSFSPIGAQASLAASGSIVGLFDGGGYTGDGHRLAPAGVVHKGEVVWNQDDVARAGGWQTVEAMRLGRRGYASGGIVGGGAMPASADGASGKSAITINNYSSAKVTTEETQDDKGNRQTVFTIADAVGDALSKKGGGAKKTLATDFGLRQRGRRR